MTKKKKADSGQPETTIDLKKFFGDAPQAADKPAVWHIGTKPVLSLKDFREDVAAWQERFSTEFYNGGRIFNLSPKVCELWNRGGLIDGMPPLPRMPDAALGDLLSNTPAAVQMAVSALNSLLRWCDAGLTEVYFICAGNIQDSTSDSLPIARTRDEEEANILVQQLQAKFAPCSFTISSWPDKATRLDQAIKLEAVKRGEHGHLAGYIAHEADELKEKLWGLAPPTIPDDWPTEPASDPQATVENYSPEQPGIPDPEAKLVRSMKGNSRALLLHLWKRDNVSLDELRTVLHVERKRKDQTAKPPTDKAVDDAVEYLQQKLTEAGYTKTMVEKNGGLYLLSHPQK